MVYNVSIKTVTETVARTKAYREAAVGASRKSVTLSEDHSRVADANQVVSVDSLGVTEARIVRCVNMVVIFLCTVSVLEFVKIISSYYK